MAEPTKNLKLLALDAEDLRIISAHCQDAIIRLNNISYLKQQRIFSLIINRFDWHGTENADKKNPKLTRRNTALHFKSVDRVQHLNLNKSSNSDTIELLSINFTENTDPSGEIILIFSGGGEIKLDVECIEVELTDLGAMWETKIKPHHKIEDE